MRTVDLTQVSLLTADFLPKIFCGEFFVVKKLLIEVIEVGTARKPSCGGRSCVYTDLFCYLQAVYILQAKNRTKIYNLNQNSFSLKVSACCLSSNCPVAV